MLTARLASLRTEWADNLLNDISDCTIASWASAISVNTGGPTNTVAITIRRQLLDCLYFKGNGEVVSDYRLFITVTLWFITFFSIHCVSKNGHPFCFCYNIVSRDQILVIFGSLVTKEICNWPLLTDLKKLLAHCVRSRTILGKCI